MKNTVRSQHASLLNGLWVNDWKYNLRVLSALMALEVLLSFSPFGFIVLPKISVTTLFIGVLVAALWGGPLGGAAVGLVFGLTSMWKASVTAVNANDLIFSPIRSGYPVKSIILALGPRVLFGIAAGLVYYAVLRLIPAKKRFQIPALVILSALLERVHSMLTYLFMDKVFQVEGAYMMKAWTSLLSTRRLQTYLVTVVIVVLAYLFYRMILSGIYYEQFRKTRELSLKIRPKYLIMMLSAVVVIGFTATHLWERIQIVLFDIDQFPKEMTNVGLIAQVIFQFVFAALSALYIVVLLYRHARNIEEVKRTEALLQLDLEKERAKQMEQRALTDPLTGVYNRKGLQKIVADEKLNAVPLSYMLIDIDHFKEINDNFGHDAGDRILLEAAACMKKQFGEKRVFRLGGDEFCVLADEGEFSTGEGLLKNWDTLTASLTRTHERLSRVLSGGVSLVTLSVGICTAESGYTEKLYQLADSALYTTKNSGRAGCTFVDEKGQTLASFRDPHAKTASLLADIGQIGSCQVIYTPDGSAKTQMFCQEGIRDLMSVPIEASPEECYEIWEAGVEPQDVEKLKEARRIVAETGVVSSSYTWNHPIRGKVRIECGATAKIRNGKLYVVSHHQLLI